MKRLRMAFVITTLIVISGLNILVHAEENIPDSDRKAIGILLEKIEQAMVKEDIDSIMSCMSPSMKKSEYDKLQKDLKEKFGDKDYVEYHFYFPHYQKFEILEPMKKLKFKVGYSEKYKFGTSGTGSSTGLTANFEVENINGKWLISYTDFYTKDHFFKIIAIPSAVLIILILVGFVFWIWMLIDCLKRDFDKPNDKIVWVLIIIFLQIIGMIIYYFMVKRKGKKEATQQTV